MRETNTTQKRVLVLSDSDLLFKVIEANLKQIHLQVDWFRPCHKNAGFSRATVILPAQGHLKQTTTIDDCDLIVIAQSSPDGEPIVTLFDAALTGQIGQVPLLIISDRSFDASQRWRIFHLGFPFESAQLRHKVQVLLA